MMVCSRCFGKYIVPVFMDKTNPRRAQTSSRMGLVLPLYQVTRIIIPWVNRPVY